MTTNDNEGMRRPATVRQIADRVAIAGLAYGAGWSVYYWHVVVGRVDPPEGFIALSVAAIALCIMTRTTYWIADRRGQQIEVRHKQEMAEMQNRHSAELAEVLGELRLLRTVVDRFGGEALEASRNAGKWEGFTTALRDQGDGGGADVRVLNGRPRRNA